MIFHYHNKLILIYDVLSSYMFIMFSLKKLKFYGDCGPGAGDRGSDMGAG